MMTWVNPSVTIPGAEIDGQTVTGTFVFPDGISVEYESRTQEFYASQGTGAVVIESVLEYLDVANESELRGEFSVDLGAGVHAITIDFVGFEGSPHQWGDSGSGGTPTDATGEDVHAQMAVFDKYLDAASLDSTNPAVLEVGEYSTAGRYEPLNVVPENPNVVFDSEERSSVFDGSVTWVSVIDASAALDLGQRLPG